MPIRLYLSLWLVSIALISFQLALIQILSIVQWHHFAAMTISVALLGFGCAGTVLALGRVWLLAHVDQVLPILLLLCSLSMPLSLLLAQGLYGGFDVYLLLIDGRQFWFLLLSQTLFLLPMLCGALAIGLIFVSRVQAIGSLYCANLLGSAGGGVLILLLMWWSEPARLPSLCALFALASGLLAIQRNSPRTLLLALACAVVIAFTLYRPPVLQISQYKALRQTLALPDARIVSEHTSPYGLLQVVDAPSLRPAPDLSLAFSGAVPVQNMAFNNGEPAGSVAGKNAVAAAALLDATPRALPYALAPRRKVLILNAGTGIDAIHAAQRGAETIVAVEPHRYLPALANSSLPLADTIHWLGMEPRAFLAANQQRFDLIVLPDVGSFGGNAGLGALAQQYLLTREAMTSVWHSLSERGVLLISAWLDEPPRNALRLAETLVSMLRDQGVEPAEGHLAAIRNWGTITFVLKRSPLSEKDRNAIRRFCSDLQFDVTLLPGLQAEERMRHHQLESEKLLHQLDTIVAGNSDRLLADYPFRLQAPTDDRPYFSQFLRWQNLPRLGGLVHQRSLPLLELAYVVELVTFAQLALAALALILLPLGRLDSRGKTSTLVYFGALGLGYMFFEIALLHQLVFYFGQPVFAAAGAISALLLFSGIGSYLSERSRLAAVCARHSTLLVAALLMALVIALPPILQSTVALDTSTRVLISLAVIALPGLAMGLPFPTGLRALARHSENQLPWAWGINGCLSVIATPLAAIIAVEAGFSRLLVLAALAYLTAAIAARR